MSRCILSGFSVFLIFFLSTCGESGDLWGTDVVNWPGWRGPEHNGISPENDWNPQALSGELQPVWEAIIGAGYSSVAIQGDYLYCSGNVDSRDIVYCLRLADGEIVWSYSYLPTREFTYAGPRAAPHIDEDRLYILSAEGRAFCLNARTGEKIWHRDLVEGINTIPYYGLSGSPIVKDDYVVFNANKHGIVLDKLTGEEIWASASGMCGYASPVLYRFKEKDYGLFFGVNTLYSVELEGGKSVWQFPWETPNDIIVADPLFAESKVFITSNYNKGCALLELTDTEPRVIWSNHNMQCHFSSVIYLDGCIYGSDGDVLTHSGAFTCLDIKTGQVKWAERLGVGSLILVGDKFIYLTERGSLFAVKADAAEYKKLSAGRLPRGVYFTAPVFCRGRLYIRNMEGSLFCIDLRQ
jgi:outer membrane protein assembly factor BamB